MRKHLWIAFAALAIGGIALTPTPAAHAQQRAQQQARPHARATTQAPAPRATRPRTTRPRTAGTRTQTRATANAARPTPRADGTAVSPDQPALADTVARALRPVSEDATRITNWVVASGDNGGLPFIVIDKVAATVTVFDPEGEILGETPALIGVATGDESTPGIGERALSEMGPAERTTPAGRFQAAFGPAIGGHTVLWVDYGNSVALHPVITTSRRERRLQRLNSPTPEDNRITYGCINVPARFFTRLIRPNFRARGGIVYILPDAKTLDDVFPQLRFSPRLRANASR